VLSAILVEKADSAGQYVPSHRVHVRRRVSGVRAHRDRHRRGGGDTTRTVAKTTLSIGSGLMAGGNQEGEYATGGRDRQQNEARHEHEDARHGRENIV